MNKLYTVLACLFLVTCSIVPSGKEDVGSFDGSLYDRAKSVVGMYFGVYVGAYSLCGCLAGYLGIVTPPVFNSEECYKSNIEKKMQHTFFSVSTGLTQTAERSHSA